MPVTSKSNLNRLQTVQNAALRTITGCHNITSEPHLHSECRMLTVQQHSNLLAAQFLVKSHDSKNPCHRITTLNQPPRTRKETLHARYHATIQPVMPAAINSQSIKTACNTLHTNAARTAVQTYHAPVLLNGWPPPTPKIDPSEATLPRKTRRMLAQLRSGHSIVLNSYKNRIDNNISNICPHCRLLPESGRRGSRAAFIE